LRGVDVFADVLAMRLETLFEVLLGGDDVFGFLQAEDGKDFHDELQVVVYYA